MRVLSHGLQQLHRQERGEVTTAVLCVPVAMLLIMAVAQAALVFHAQSIVDAAAQEGVRAGQSEHGTLAAANTAARAVTAGSDGGLLSNIRVNVDRNPSTVTVDVSAGVTSLLPGFSSTVTGRAAGPVEAFQDASRR